MNRTHYREARESEARLNMDYREMWEMLKVRLEIGENFEIVDMMNDLQEQYFKSELEKLEVDA